jgi:small-conductance mechanosensitive channel
VNDPNIFKLFKTTWQALRDWVEIDLFAPSSGTQVLVILSALAVAFTVRHFLAPHVRGLNPSGRLSPFTTVIRNLAVSLILPITWWLGVGLAGLIAHDIKYPSHLFDTAMSLLMAWIAINILLRLVRDKFWRRILLIAIWGIAALHIVGLLKPTIALLDAADFNIGTARLSLWMALKASLAFIALFQILTLVSRLLEGRIKKSSNFTPSAQLLIIQIAKIGLFAVAIMVTLEFIGVDLTTLAVFTGALGLGIGLGLQKVVSNLFSGFLLLIDRSIKPGDVVSLSKDHGRVNKMGARFVSVITPDGIEHLIPNDKFITETVENWSYSNHLVKLVIPIGVSYGSDLHKVIEIVETEAKEVPRILADPAPACRLYAFGDSSVDFNAFLWINDPEKGVYGPRHEFLLRIWDRFHAEGIEIPFPQRDVHIRTTVEKTS